MNEPIKQLAPVVRSGYRHGDTALVVVSMESQGVPCLKQHVDRDITKVTWGGLKLPGYGLFELLTIDRLLTYDITNVVMTHAERTLVASYCNHYRICARDNRDELLTRLYDELLTALLDDCTHIIQLWT